MASGTQQAMGALAKFADQEYGLVG
jgi:hypothetical protein